MKNQMSEIKSEMKTQMSEIKSDMKTQMSEIQSEMKNQIFQIVKLLTEKQKPDSPVVNVEQKGK